MSKTPPGLWAFWPYDQFPFYLSGKVTSFDPDQPELVRVEGYKSHRFRYVALLPGKRGEELHRYLKAARSVYRDMQECGENAMRDAVMAELDKHHVPGTRKLFRAGGRYAALRNVFEVAVQKCLDGEAPTFSLLRREDVEKTGECEK